MTIQNNTEIVVKGEAHYLWPIDDYNGYTPKCSECEYYEALPEKKTTYDGECTSVAMNTDRTYLHRSSGNDFVTSSNCGCKWMITVLLQRGEKMRLIDVDEIRLPHGFFEKVDNVPKFYEWLGTLPTIDAELIRHGHWRADETVYTTGEVWCSVCRTLYYIGDLYDVGGGNNLPNYCPHCGAKMDGGNT